MCACVLCLLVFINKFASIETHFVVAVCVSVCVVFFLLKKKEEVCLSVFMFVIFISHMM